MKNHLKRIFPILSIAVLFTISACGTSDPKDQTVQAPATPTQPLPSIPSTPSVPALSNKRNAMLTVQWAISESSGIRSSLSRTISANQNRYQSFTVDGPITLPQYGIDSADLFVNDLPARVKTEQSKLETRIKIKSATSGSSADLSLSTVSIPYERTETGISGIHFTISGLSHALNLISDKEERISITLTLSADDKDDNPITLDFVFLSPPSKLVFIQRSVNEFENTTHALGEGLKYLEAESIKLLLIQVVELQNLSDQPISVELPSNIHGKFWQNSTWTDPQYGDFAKTLCLEMPKTIDTQEIFSTDFTLLPLTDKLSTEWGSLLNNETNAIDLFPKERKLFGIYGLPTSSYAHDFKNLLNSRNPKESARLNPPQLISIDTQCNFECSSYNQTNSFKNQCSSIPTGERVQRQFCDKRISDCSWCFSASTSPLKREYCNQCFKSEYMEGEDGIANYKGELACSTGWQKKSLKSKSAWKTNEVGAITLEIQEGGILADVRYANLPKDKDPESRMIEIMRKISIQNY